MTIGDVARVTALPAKTIRYYEDIGQVNTARDANGYRRFNDNDLHKLGFIGRAHSRLHDRGLPCPSGLVREQGPREREC